MRSITTFDLQYAHRFYGFQGEAQYLHGHTGVLTIEVEDTVNEGVNMVYPCNEIQKVAWDVLKNFDHALVLREDDPLLPAILDVYEKQGIKNGHPQNKIPPLLWGLILIFNSDDFVAADLQIRPSCATILSDVHPPIIVLKKLPVTGGNLCAINLLRD